METVNVATVMLSDLTFEPNCCSTQNFAKMARMASTPFNPADDNALPTCSLR